MSRTAAQAPKSTIHGEAGINNWRPGSTDPLSARRKKAIDESGERFREKLLRDTAEAFAKGWRPPNRSS